MRSCYLPPECVEEDREAGTSLRRALKYDQGVTWPAKWKRELGTTLHDAAGSRWCDQIGSNTPLHATGSANVPSSPHLSTSKHVVALKGEHQVASSNVHRLRTPQATTRERLSGQIQISRVAISVISEGPGQHEVLADHETTDFRSAVGSLSYITTNYAHTYRMKSTCLDYTWVHQQREQHDSSSKRQSRCGPGSTAWHLESLIEAAMELFEHQVKIEHL